MGVGFNCGDTGKGFGKVFADFKVCHESAVKKFVPRTNLLLVVLVLVGCLVNRNGLFFG
ncbi:hypothetical protein JYU12_00240 [bacterium AH-315-K03]|nr:hypothetical protein [bacterium AH-315-K03]